MKWSHFGAVGLIDMNEFIAKFRKFQDVYFNLDIKTAELQNFKNKIKDCNANISVSPRKLNR